MSPGEGWPGTQCRQVAEYLGVSPKTVRRLVAGGRLPAALTPRKPDDYHAASVRSPSPSRRSSRAAGRRPFLGVSVP
ncbi:MAG: helix-turn-helix domain-containing protein [Candidatus Eisenbacteria bacterium]|nr:helix-turn-helix domain-containing protein [Candidatus Eisenbacteria bacterium]